MNEPETEKTKTVFIHEITLPGNDEFSKKFNGVSHLFQQAMRKDIPEAEAREYWDAYCNAKWFLEMGA